MRKTSVRTVWLVGCLVWTALVLLVAQLSGYRADAVKVINWPIALMLTPWGLLQNLVLGAHEHLHRVYGQAPPPLDLSGNFSVWNWHYAQIYLQSNLLEVLPLLLLWPRWRPAGWRAVQISVLNLFTHPIVFFGIMRLPWAYLPNILLAEAFAILVEWRVYRRLGLPSPFLASLFANLISWQFAPALTVYFFLGDKF